MKKFFVGFAIGISLLAAGAVAQQMYGNSFPFWDVRGPLTTQTLAVSGTSTFSGLTTFSGGTATTAPRTITASTDSPAANENHLIANFAGTVTLTLAAASSNTGRRFCIKTIQAQTVVSGSSNVVPAATATPGTAILAGTAGKFACLVSDGTNWVIFDNN